MLLNTVEETQMCFINFVVLDNCNGLMLNLLQITKIHIAIIFLTFYPEQMPNALRNYVLKDVLQVHPICQSINSFSDKEFF